MKETKENVNENENENFILLSKVEYLNGKKKSII